MLLQVQYAAAQGAVQQIEGVQLRDASQQAAEGLMQWQDAGATAVGAVVAGPAGMDLGSQLCSLLHIIRAWRCHKLL